MFYITMHFSTIGSNTSSNSLKMAVNALLTVVSQVAAMYPPKLDINVNLIHF